MDPAEIARLDALARSLVAGDDQLQARVYFDRAHGTLTCDVSFNPRDPKSGLTTRDYGRAIKVADKPAAELEQFVREVIGRVLSMVGVRPASSGA